MWELLSRRTQVLILVSVTAVILVTLQQIVGLLFGEQVSLFRGIAAAVFIIVVVLVAGANWTWRSIWRKWPVFGRKLFPDLNGTWKGTLQTTWKDEAGKVPGPIELTVWIRQNFFTTSIHFRTNESESWSTRLIAEPYPDEGRYRLWYSYENRPDAQLGHRSGHHEGVAWLQIAPSIDSKKMKGQYYTSRLTNGDIDIAQVNRDIRE